MTGSAQPSFGPPEGQGRGDGADNSTGARMVAWEKDPTFAWHTTLKGEQLSWSRWRADYRIERSFRADGTWRDSIRFDLCQEGRNLLLYAQYPPGVEATEEMARKVVRTVEMIAAE